tara:strand:+ start:1771 stop:2214 length:444 start_codon:yes stop_codon:yes gene_type:complete
MGGTFDILHIGHKALLAQASDIGDKVLVGLTTDARAKKNRDTVHINSYDIRKRNLESLLESLGFLYKFEIVPLNDDWGPSVIDEDFEAIVVSEETKSTADKINKIRSKEGKNQLHIVVVPMIQSSDGQFISSSRIRNNEIDSSGNLT